ncbi:MAG TPA: hypothetical protein VHZ51_12225 [Ktedonobacteraceae bacterium]|jgi:hypothetical protein|nr:hypothetical protein [Ktedonobacteraceae bacterium]
MKAYSLDLREHVLQAVDYGYPRGEIVYMFSIRAVSPLAFQTGG